MKLLNFPKIEIEKPITIYFGGLKGVRDEYIIQPKVVELPGLPKFIPVVVEMTVDELTEFVNTPTPKRDIIIDKFEFFGAFISSLNANSKNSPDIEITIYYDTFKIRE